MTSHRAQFAGKRLSAEVSSASSVWSVETTHDRSPAGQTVLLVQIVVVGVGDAGLLVGMVEDLGTGGGV